MEKIMEKTVYFVRHGQSEGNIGDVFQGPDSPLTSHGQAQAGFIGQRLQQLGIQALIASPWLRAMQTAEIIGQTIGLTPEFSSLMVERQRPSRGVGQSRLDKEACQLEEEWTRSLYQEGLKAEDGENYSEIVARADQCLAFLAERPEQRVAVVSHGYFLRTVVARVLLGSHLSPLAFESFQTHIALKNTGLTVLTCSQDMGWKLRIFNDHAHLAD